MKFESRFWKIFTMPGRFILWDRYTSPPKGKVFETARQRKDPFYIIMYSVVGWFFIGYFLLVALIYCFTYFFPEEAFTLFTDSQEPVAVQAPVPQINSSSSTSVRNQVF